MRDDIKNENFNKQLADISILNDSKKLEEYILSKILKIKSPLFNVKVEQEEILKIIVSYDDKKECFEIFDVTPEALDVTIEKVNKYVEEI